MKLDLLAGYRDENGNVHKDCDFILIDGEIEEKIAKNKGNGSKMLRAGFSECCTRIGEYVKSSTKRSEWDKIVNSLLAQDIDYAMVHLRKESYGEEIKLNHQCKECKGQLETSLFIDELEYKEFLGDYEIAFELPVGVMGSDGEITRCGIIRLPNILDREIVEPLAKTNPANATTMLLARCVTEIEGLKTITNQTFKKMIAKDREYLMNLLNENNFGYDFHVTYTCSSCGHEFQGLMNVVNFI